MAKHVRSHNETTVRRKQEQEHKAPKNRYRTVPKRNGQTSDAKVLPNAIEFLEIDVVGPFDADEESEFVAEQEFEDTFSGAIRCGPRRLSKV